MQKVASCKAQEISDAILASIVPKSKQCFSSAVFSGDAGGARAPPEFGGFRKGAKPDFCLSEFSYYYQQPRI